MAKNRSYLDRIQKAKKQGFLMGQHFTRQLCMDQAGIILNREFGFGADRLERFNAGMIEMYAEFADVWNSDTNDVEYSKATMDRALKRIWGDRFVPWKERYG